ncbi:hypothetical protein D3C71_1808730 [compost metagenome]
MFTLSPMHAANDGRKRIILVLVGLSHRLHHEPQPLFQTNRTVCERSLDQQCCIDRLLFLLLSKNRRSNDRILRIRVTMSYICDA